MPPKSESKRSKISIIRFIYLYLISAITFIVFIIGAVTLVNQGLKTFVFGVEEYDYYETRPVQVMIDCTGLESEELDNCIAKQKMVEEEETEVPKSIYTNEVKRTLSIGIAQVLVAFPLWIFHWRIIERDRKRKLAKK